MEEGVDLLAVRHGGGGAGAGDGDSSYGAGEGGGFDEVTAFGEGGGQASVEGVSCSGGFDYWARVDGWDVVGEGAVFDEGALSAEGEDDIADSAIEEGDSGSFGRGEVGDRDSGEGGGFGLVGGEVVAEGVDRFGEWGGGGWVEDRRDALGVG